MQVITTLTSSWSILYFISWYVLAVVVMFNLVVAHVLDGFFDGSLALSHTWLVQEQEEYAPRPPSTMVPALSPLVASNGPSRHPTEDSNSLASPHPEASPHTCHASSDEGDRLQATQDDSGHHDSGCAASDADSCHVRSSVAVADE